MPYEKTTWKSGDVISTARLNKIEQGIEDAGNGALPTVTAEDDGKVLGVENGEWGAVSISTAPPDWNAKEGEEGYIANKPFYDGRELELVCEFEGELDQQVVSFSPIPIDDKYLNYDNDYIVDINGVIEENFKYQTRPYIGSHFFSADSGNYILIDTTSTPKTTHTFWADPKYAETISHYNVKLYLLNGGEIHTINSIYLPEGAILKNIRDGVTRSVEEGGNSIASGYQAHAEGSYTTASGDISHAEGEYTTASGIHSHAEGQYTTASSGDSHAEGFRTTASGYQAHAEGDDTISSGMCSHAEGKYTTAFGDSSHAEGHFGYAKGEASHVEGGKIQEAVKIRLSGDANARTYNVIEQPYGTLTLIGRYIGYSSNYVRVVSETKNNSGTIVSITVDKTLSETAITNQYYPLEVCSVATGISSHAEGANTTAANNFAHSEGYGSHASGIAAHAEGDHTSASGYDSHAEGCVTVASGREAHAEGIGSKASGDESHAEGSYTTASGNFSHAEGQGTVANHVSQHVFGQYNIADPSSATNNNRGDYVEIVGNGTSNQAQSNARTLDWSGNEVLAGNLTLGMGANAATLTPEKINQIGQGGGADWNAKQGSSSYIANKPFYDDRELGTIWQVEGLYFSDGSCYPPSNTIFKPTLDTNASYYVEVEGVKIDNLTYDMENGRIGNRLFGLTVQGGKLTSVIDNSGTITDGTHTLMLGIYEGNLVKIDEKYLPDDIRLLNIRDGEGVGAIVEGTDTKANGSYSHAEGINTTSFGMAAHAEGYFTQASGIYAHAEGSNTVAGELNSHAEGLNTSALANNSHAEGWNTIANHKSQHVFGEYNIADGSTSASKRGNYVEIVGNGTSGSARSNARTLDWDGNETLAGKLTVGSDPTENMDVATKQYVDNGLSGKADSSTLHLIKSELGELIGNNEQIEISFTYGTWINTGGAVEIGDTVDISNLTEWYSLKHAIVECQEGDKFLLDITGATNARAYAFLTNDNVLISRSDAEQIISGYITAPQDAGKVIIQGIYRQSNDDTVTDEGTAYKIVTGLENVVRFDVVQNKTEAEKARARKNIGINPDGGLSEEAKRALLNCFAHVAWIDEHGQDYYDALHDVLYASSVSRISASFAQEANEIYPTFTLDMLKQWLTVTAHTIGGESYQVTGYSLFGDLEIGTSQITVTYLDKTTTFDVIVTGDTYLYSLPQTTVFNGTSTIINTNVKLLQDDIDFSIVIDAMFSGTEQKNYTMWHCMHEVSPYSGHSYVFYTTTTSGKWAPTLHAWDGQGYGSPQFKNGDRNKVVITHKSGTGVAHTHALIGNTLKKTASGAYTYISVSEPLVIGGYRSNTGSYGRHWKGTIYDFRVFDRCLTDDEASKYLEG